MNCRRYSGSSRSRPRSSQNAEPLAAIRHLQVSDRNICGTPCRPAILRPTSPGPVKFGRLVHRHVLLQAVLGARWSKRAAELERDRDGRTSARKRGAYEPLGKPRLFLVGTPASGRTEAL
jgi:hypothetical protein